MTTNLFMGSDGFMENLLCDYLGGECGKIAYFGLKGIAAEEARSAKFHSQRINRIDFFARQVGGAKYIQRYRQWHKA